jgi:hypothetical protein
MTTIYKIPSITQRFFEYNSESTATLEHQFTITDTKLDYKFIVNAVTELDFELSLAELKKSLRYSENSWLSVAVKFKDTNDNFINMELPGPLDHSIIDRNGIINLLDYSTIGKNNSIVNLMDRSNPVRHMPFKFFVESFSDNFSTFKYTLDIPEIDDDIQHVTTVTVNDQPFTCDNSYSGWKSFISPITATSNADVVTPGTTIKVDIETNPSISYVYLEQVCGVLDRVKVKLNNGIGSFNILTDTLESGDIAEVKIGHKKFTNVTEFTKSIS